jgi:PKD repeat protein
MTKKLAVLLAAAAASFACTVHKTEAPDLSGPSTLALSLQMSATPDSITQDGGSQSSIKVTAIGPNGQSVSGLPVRLNIEVNGVPVDFGTLSARTIVTGSDGTASAVYTAPTQARGGNTPLCGQAIGTCVTIVAIPTGTDFQTANGQSVTIRLVPPGVILPPADTPTARFKISPETPSVGQPVLFDATSSCGGSAENETTCRPSSNTIERFDWDFGDGTTGTGATATHTYATARSYAVTLTVTNDRGLAASTTRTIELGASSPPSASFVFSPNDPAPGDVVIFTDTSRAVAGRTNVRLDWNFGDPDKPSGGTASGSTVQNTYQREGSFVVTLTVTDDLGQRSVATQSVNVKRKTTTP